MNPITPATSTTRLITYPITFYLLGIYPTCLAYAKMFQLHLQPTNKQRPVSPNHKPQPRGRNFSHIPKVISNVRQRGAISTVISVLLILYGLFPALAQTHALCPQAARQQSYQASCPDSPSSCCGPGCCCETKAHLNTTHQPFTGYAVPTRPFRCPEGCLYSSSGVRQALSSLVSAGKSQIPKASFLCYVKTDLKGDNRQGQQVLNLRRRDKIKPSLELGLFSSYSSTLPPPSGALLPPLR